MEKVNKRYRPKLNNDHLLVRIGGSNKDEDRKVATRGRGAKKYEKRKISNRHGESNRNGRGANKNEKRKITNRDRGSNREEIRKISIVDRLSNSNARRKSITGIRIETVSSDEYEIDADEYSRSYNNEMTPHYNRIMNIEKKKGEIYPESRNTSRIKSMIENTLNTINSDRPYERKGGIVRFLDSEVKFMQIKCCLVDFGEEDSSDEEDSCY